jgi:hypothetical protein
MRSGGKFTKWLSFILTQYGFALFRYMFTAVTCAQAQKWWQGLGLGAGLPPLWGQGLDLQQNFSNVQHTI